MFGFFRPFLQNGWLRLHYLAQQRLKLQILNDGGHPAHILQLILEHTHIAACFNYTVAFGMKI